MDKVIEYFKEISKIPRGSGNEKAVSCYIADFARERGAKVIQDDWNNLIISKPASLNGKGKPPVILQAHLDMVCEKNAETKHDFMRDPIDLYEDGDYIKARGTTLGADNGIGIAMCMAVLDGGYEHPPLEILLTTEEETGMDGAKNLDISLLKGRRIINLDSSDDTTFTMGCAAGTTAEFVIPAERTSSECGICEIYVKGLKGGHSGGDIEKERGNALKILAFLLSGLGEVKIIEISGGMKVNAIPREAYGKIAFSASTEEITSLLETARKNFAEQFRVSEPDLKIEYTFTKSRNTECFTPLCSRKIISSLLLIPTGVLSMSLEIEGLPNASNNIGVAETTDKHVKISCMPRGAAEFYTKQIESQISALADLVGAEVNFTQRSPAWQYNPESPLLRTAMKVYKNVLGSEASATAVHGGLECGVFIEKFADKNLDIISFGPNAYDYHTPSERVSLSSIGRTWEFLQALLKELCV
jgi:dipeptidase D